MHRRSQRQPEVDLGEAPIASVVAHDHEIVGDGEHGATCEGMAVDRRDRDAGKAEHAPEQTVHAGEQRFGLIAMGSHPVEVEPVGIELPGAGRDHRERAIDGGQLVEHRVPFRYRVTVETILAFARVHDGNGAASFDFQHSGNTRAGRWPLDEPPA